MKPSDLYVGVIDFFSTLIPGGIAVLFVLNSAQGDTLRRWIFRQESSTENWVVFLVLAYVLGHLIAALGEAVLDPIYRRTYTHVELIPSGASRHRSMPSRSYHPMRLAGR
jgi:hypothetical protein